MISVPLQPRHQTGLRLEFACELKAVRPAVTQALAFLRTEGVGSEDLSTCELALVEACNNAVEHVTPPHHLEPVTLEVLCNAEALEFRIQDHTRGLEWPVVPQLPPDDSEHGRGLFLIHSVVTTAEYYRGRTSNCLVLTKIRSKPPLDQSEVDSGIAQLKDRIEESEKIIRDMADELSSCYESLSAIFRYSGEQSRAVSMEDFTRRLLGDLLQITSNSWYQFRLLEPNLKRLELAACSLPDLRVEALALPGTSSPDLPLEIIAVQEHRDCWFERSSALPPNDPLHRFGTDSAGLVHPLYLGDELVGTLAVGGPASDRRFTAAQTNVIQTFADFLAIQVVNARFHEQRVKSLLVARELEIAKQIQQSLLPDTLPQLPGLMVEGYCESAREVGGDFFDVITLTDGSLLAVVGDAMGKGLPAAMFAMILRSLVRALQDRGPQPAILLRRANELLYDELSGMEMFITAQVAHVDPRTGVVTVANAGHCPLLHCPGPGRPVAALSPDGVPLGVLEATEFAEHRFTLDPGSRALMYTDGLAETAGPDQVFLGQDRLTGWLIEQTTTGKTAHAMKGLLRKYLTDNQGSPALADDRTFVILGR